MNPSLLNAFNIYTKKDTWAVDSFVNSSLFWDLFDSFIRFIPVGTAHKNSVTHLKGYFNHSLAQTVFFL